MRLRPLIALANERTNCRRRSVEGGYAILLDDLPEAGESRIIRCALVHYYGRARRERPINNVAMSGDPAYVGCAPVHVVFFQIEDPLHGHRGLQEITGCGVQNALWLSGCA